MECRLLYLVGHLGSGGLERQLCYLLQAMDRKRYQPAVAVWSFREEDAHVPQIRALGVPLYSFPGAPSGTAKLAAFSHLVVSDRVLDEIGPAVNSGHSIFMYGPPGNGKTVMSRAIRTLLTDSPRETARLLFDKAVLRALELFE